MRRRMRRASESLMGEHLLGLNDDLDKVHADLMHALSDVDLGFAPKRRTIEGPGWNIREPLVGTEASTTQEFENAGGPAIPGLGELGQRRCESVARLQVSLWSL